MEGVAGYLEAEKEEGELVDAEEMVHFGRLRVDRI